jgi:hypothetical protein
MSRGSKPEPVWLASVVAKVSAIHFRDFHLRLEARINDGGFGGVLFRTSFGPSRPPDNPWHPLGYIGRISTAPGQKTGGLSSLSDGTDLQIGVNESLISPNNWFVFEVIPKKNHIITKVNGKTAVEHIDLTSEFTSGHIALQIGITTRRPTIIEFRKIEIKELPGQ